MDDTDEISEIISSCKDYNSQLSKCMHSLDESLNVIYSSAEESSKIVNRYFGDLLESVTALIKENEEEMLAKIDSLKSNVVQPLTQSMKLVQQKLMNSENILEECKAIKETKLDKVSYNLKLAALDRMTVSVGSLPEVPALHNMPVLTVSMNHSCSNDIKKQLKNVGEIICACPVQFTNWKELPGSISLHWQEMNEEELEDPKFCIRYCRGNMKKRNSSTGSFTMVYPGSDDSSLIIRNLELGAFYSFQVAYSNETMARNKIFSNIIWSYPLVLSTSLPHYRKYRNLVVIFCFIFSVPI
ncbi:Cytokine receptor-like factor 3 [Nymphon striatum]|nr:Cytokine receptor-like factor 3 [Nymphon striatum]